MVPYHRTFDAMAGMFGWMFRVAGVPFGFLEGKSFLEIGTGQYMNHPFCALVCGASEVWTYDVKDNRVPCQGDPFGSTVMANRFLSGLVFQHDFEERMAKYALQDITFTTEWPINGFGVVFSYSVLEHIPPENVGSAMLNIKKCINNFGISLHYIDLSDKNKSNNYNVFDWENIFRALRWAVDIPFQAYDGSYMIIKTS